VFSCLGVAGAVVLFFTPLLLGAGGRLTIALGIPALVVAVAVLGLILHG